MAHGRRTRILIVDDSAVMRSLLRSVIVPIPTLKSPVPPPTAPPLSAIESPSPDLVLLDVEMPVMDGLVTLRELRSRGYKMPVIMCSAHPARRPRHH